ncbi:hypothetical protein CH359_02285 [Leptospira meyeri]|nr:hypothetical protein CH359_02285 [Leptospira meyeri]PJZ97970.1 hypothetical protein CH358_03085 [Leptospira meyeri]PKA11412.1 hypothetical protein CH372_14495 [Leptospira meyeri]
MGRIGSKDCKRRSFMVPSTPINSIVNLPKEIFQAQNQLNEKLMKLAVEEKVGSSAKSERLLDIYC